MAIGAQPVDKAMSIGEIAHHKHMAGQAVKSERNWKPGVGLLSGRMHGGWKGSTHMTRFLNFTPRETEVKSSLVGAFTQLGGQDCTPEQASYYSTAIKAPRPPVPAFELKCANKVHAPAPSSNPPAPKESNTSPPLSLFPLGRLSFFPVFFHCVVTSFVPSTSLLDEPVATEARCRSSFDKVPWVEFDVGEQENRSDDEIYQQKPAPPASM
ncbi:hypothetical protein BDV93DRAFT_516320 [Ceratobasidium sp. AG-I]|nr:hypothetical protein BDV93DRAFT_516320 [Ceratobasidium sp. AG-I]